MPRPRSRGVAVVPTFAFAVLGTAAPDVLKDAPVAARRAVSRCTLGAMPRAANV